MVATASRVDTLEAPHRRRQTTSPVGPLEMEQAGRAGEGISGAIAIALYTVSAPCPALRDDARENKHDSCGYLSPRPAPGHLQKPCPISHLNVELASFAGRNPARIAR